MRKVSLKLAIFTAMTFISFSHLTTAFADQITGGEVGNPIDKSLCEVRLDANLFGSEPYKSNFKELLLKKGYTIITEEKKGAYSLVPGYNAGCFSGLVMGHSCSVSLSLQHYKGDDAPSGLKITNPYNKRNTISTANYNNYSLFFKPKLEDMVVEVLKTKLITCEEAKKLKDSEKGDDFVTDINALSSACERNESIDLNTYNYYVGQLEKYKISPDVVYADNPFGKNTLSRLERVLRDCPSLADKTKMANSMDDSSRAAKPTTSKKSDGAKADGASR